MADVTKRHPLISSLFLAAFVVFFGGGFLLFINLFIPFLPEAVFYIISISVGAILVVLMVVGKCMPVVRAKNQDDVPRRWSRR